MAVLREIYLELSGTCNVACSYCTWRQRETGATLMNMGLAFRLIDEALAFDPRPEITLHSVGESTLHPRLVDILRYCQSRGVSTRLSTNCVLLEGDLAASIGEIYNLEMILAIHDGLPDKTLAHVVQNALDYLASKPKNRRLEVLSVCTQGRSLRSSWFCETFLSLIERLPQARLHFKQPCTFPTAKEAVRGEIPHVGDHPQIYLDRTATPRSLGRGCSMPTYLLGVQADGTLSPCCVGQESWGLGTAHGRSLHSIWHSERLKEIRGLWARADDSLLCGHCLKRTDC